MRDPWKYLFKPDSQDLQKVFDYTNFFLNVGNYIVPAQKEGLIGEVLQIRGEGALKEYLQDSQNLSSTLSCEEREHIAVPFSSEEKGFRIEVLCEKSRDRWRKTILNLDLDFFEPELDFIDYDLKKQVILDIARRADVITVCTSPYFIEQQRALEVFRDLFFE